MRAQKCERISICDNNTVTVLRFIVVDNSLKCACVCKCICWFVCLINMRKTMAILFCLLMSAVTPPHTFSLSISFLFSPREF